MILNNSDTYTIDPLVEPTGQTTVVDGGGHIDTGIIVGENINTVSVTFT